MPVEKTSVVIGPHLINAIVHPALTGALLAASGVYFFHFSGKNGDRWFLQLGVAFAVIVYTFNSVVLIENIYSRIVGAALGATGWEMTSIGWQVATVSILMTFPMALGQLYFLARTGKFFTRGKKVFLAIGAFLISVQMAFGLLPLVVYVQTLDYATVLSSTVMRTINNSTVVGYVAMVIINEVYFSLTLLYKLYQLRRNSSLAAANAVMYKLGILAVQSNVLLVVSGVAVLLTHRVASTGWFLTVLIAQHPLHALFVVTNLIYRPSMKAELEQGISDLKASSQTPPFSAISVGDDLEGRLGPSAGGLSGCGGHRTSASTAMATARAMAAAGWRYEVTTSSKEQRTDDIPLPARTGTTTATVVGDEKVYADMHRAHDEHPRQLQHHHHVHHHLPPSEKSLRRISSYSDEERSTVLPAALGGVDAHALALEAPWSLRGPTSIATTTTTASAHHYDHAHPLYDHDNGELSASPKPSTHYSSNF
ncbi:uncharacterized protein PSFLO_02636 [Pseudozyma flocculosa]|nr:uncharacterized protein PSFLO_02636 [Pseudozyma flocculosa]